MKEAQFYRRQEGNLRCSLCPHHCCIKDGHAGLCGGRKAIGERLYSINYGKISGIQIDPIEKKPLFHFMPGSHTLSIGSFGCNLNCEFCQNHHIAAGTPQTIEMSPADVVKEAINYSVPSISYTYNEPIIFYEFVRDTAQLAKKVGIKNILITNGFIEEQPLKELLPYIDAMNIDLKTFNDKTYMKFCGGHIEPVKRTIKIAEKSCHIEITTLVVTKMNDNVEEIGDLSHWLSEVNPLIPLHLTRYFPRNRYTEPATELCKLKTIKREAEKFLEYVYLGNV
ncbi:AmmeMemoRadiSam system radical SAM enzyme [Alkaliphilus peptidifermentans]|nr:AmmeMemoRadiSam system radical SAM enzyme [Alkaliphilus peptidifermentans]